MASWYFPASSYDSDGGADSAAQLWKIGRRGDGLLRGERGARLHGGGAGPEGLGLLGGGDLLARPGAHGAAVEMEIARLGQKLRHQRVGPAAPPEGAGGIVFIVSGHKNAPLSVAE